MRTLAAKARQAETIKPHPLNPERSRLESELVAAILCDPAGGVPVALGQGVSAETFHRPDMRVAFCVACICHVKPRRLMLGLIWQGFQNDGFDKPTRTPRYIGRPVVWRTLDQVKVFADSFSPGPTSVQAATITTVARELKLIIARIGANT